MEKLESISEIVVDTHWQEGSLENIVPARTWRTRAAMLVSVAFFARIAIIATTKISNCEAYYYVWSRFLSWSYYDHPPLVAWMT